MYKTILLLTPVYITLFWAIVLHTDNRNQTVPRLFLGKFMFAAFLVYLSHFIYYSGFSSLYICLDPIYQLVSLLVYPLYHIYFRLLTVDPKFSLKRHIVFIIGPILLFLFYSLGVFMIDPKDFEIWVYNHDVPSNSFYISYLKAISFFISIFSIVQILFVVVANFILIKEYGDKARHYYSDAVDSTTLRVNLLNVSMIITGVSSIVLASLGRNYFQNDSVGMLVAAIIFSCMLFLIGWLGDRQKSLNPTTDELESNKAAISESENLTESQPALIDKITQLFEEKHIFLNCKLNIMDIASEVGSNRTYISYLINQKFNQNFCSFVNQYRIRMLEEKVKSKPDMANHQLAEQCGFGSVDSMKRAVLNKTGLSLSDWKNTLLAPKL